MSKIEQQFAEEDMRQIPTLARIAFAARCARLVFPRFRHAWPDAPPEIVASLECCLRCVEGVGKGDSVADTMATAPSVVRIARGACTFAPIASAVASTIHAAAMTAYYGKYMSSVLHSHFQAAATATRALQASGHNRQLGEQLRHDYASLLHATNENHWDYTTTVPPTFFTYLPRFDLEAVASEQPGITRGTPIDAILVQRLRSKPLDVYVLTSRQFEELIAELFRGFGFDCSLTQQTRDNGRDIVAVKRNEATLRYLIECKKYAPDRKIGVPLVRQLHGVVTNERGTKGILVTTSSFTPPAREFLSKNEWILEGCDFSGLNRWIGRYTSGLIHEFSRNLAKA